MKFKTVTLIILLIVISFFVRFDIYNLNQLEQDFNNKIERSEISNPIHIIGNQGWEDFKNNGNCTGSGTDSDPYIIEDLEIDAGGSGSCIWIENSDVFFTINNCTVYKAGPNPSDAAIKLNNSKKGDIIHNNCSFNDRHGILLENCTNIFISENEASENLYTGQIG